MIRAMPLVLSVSNEVWFAPAPNLSFTVAGLIHHSQTPPPTDPGRSELQLYGRVHILEQVSPDPADNRDLTATAIPGHAIEWPTKPHRANAIALRR